MAEQAQAAADTVKDAVQNVADKVNELTTGDAAAAEGKTHLDEVTGEHVSKSERRWKRLNLVQVWIRRLTTTSEEAPEAA